ncbi:hypothetical protein AVEN_24096-1 [Araneus ventricosus]|uniref:Uncharacterized protein n=1 Tax=Araneus ventricosus TaxID=182803 RepID=A0A4Y2GKX4_ARAVE|nr:hypothetical protein AVEN_24096-1 [Araneus ventricosus]
MWDDLNSSLRDVPSSSGFISFKKRQVRRRTELRQSSSLDSSNPVITFPSTVSYFLNTDTSSCSGKSSTTKLVLDENLNDTIATNLENSTIPKQRNKIHNRFGKNRRSAVKGDTVFSSASVSSSNVASEFHRQRSRSLESTDISNDYAQDTPF